MKRKERINLLTEFSIPLISGVIVALIWANINPEGYHNFVHTEIFGGINFHFFVQDIFMVFFFAIAAVEITQSFLPGGDLNPLKKAINPLIGTIGGVVGPVAAFFILNSLMGSPDYVNGWGIPTATDIALAWLIAKFVFGKSHPAVTFLLLLAIVDDAIGLIIIAVFYPDPSHPFEPMWLLAVLAGMIVSFVLRKFNVKNYWPYILLGGILSWLGLHNAHLHTSLALVVIVPFLPHAKTADGHLYEDTHTNFSTLKHFEHDWKVFVDLGLFLFGIANAGVAFTQIDNLSWIILLSLVLGKTLGIYVFSGVADKIGFTLPTGMKMKDLFVAGVIAALGLTVALFIADSAFVDEALKGAAKMGALFSAFVAILALILGKVLRIQKRK